MNKQYKTILTRIILSYLLILIIPLSVIAVTYFTSGATLEDFATKQTQNSLSTLSKSIDTRLKELEAISMYIYSSEETNSLLNSTKIDYTNKKIYNAYKLSRALPKFNLTNTIIKDAKVIFNNAQYVISPGTSVPHDERFFSSSMQLPNYSIDEFNEIVFSKVYINDFITLDPADNDSFPTSYYIHSLPNNTNAHNIMGVIFIPIDEAFLLDSLKNIDKDYSRISYITDQDGKVLSYNIGKNVTVHYDNANDKDIDITSLSSFNDLIANKSFYTDNNYITTSSTSTYNNWTYYSIVPKQAIMSEVSYLKNLIIVLSIISVIFCFVVTTIALRDKVSIFKKVFDATNVLDVKLSNKKYKYIETAIDSLVDSNTHMLSSISNQRTLLESSIARRLMYGDYNDSNDLAYFTKILDMDLKDKAFIVFIVNFSHCDEPNKDTPFNFLSFIGLYIKNTLKKYIEKQYYLFDIDEKNIAVLLIDDNNGANSDNLIAFANQLTDNLYDDLIKSNNIYTKYAISSVYTGITKINNAYKEASDVNQYLLSMNEQNKLFYWEIPINNHSYYYPIEIELQLIKLVKYGDQNELSKLFKMLYNENFVKRTLSISMVKQLVFAMRSTIIRGFKDVIVDDTIHEMIDVLSRAHSTDEIFNCVIRINLEMCRINNQEILAKDEELKAQILAFISENYQHSDLTIHTLVDKFSMSETSIYHFFKRAVGKSFAELLEEIRIEHACTLLSNKTIPIKDISQQVGYNNDTSFRRAFKRVLGITPSDYGK